MLSVYGAHCSLGMHAYHTHLILEAPGQGFDVSVEDGVESFLCHVLESAGLEDAGVVEGHVKRSKRFNRGVHHLLAPFFLEPLKKTCTT